MYPWVLKEMEVGMSSVPERIHAIIEPIVRTQSHLPKMPKDPVSVQSRRALHLSRFNIVKLEALHLFSLRVLVPEVPVTRLPLLDLPSAKLLSIFSNFFYNFYCLFRFANRCCILPSRGIYFQRTFLFD